jgi:ATP-dependent protease ClpP protease subunit
MVEYGHRDIALILDSPGGDGEAVLEFIATLKKLPSTVHVKAYRADSAAALLLFEAPGHAELDRGSSVEVHLSTVKVDALSISEDGKIPDDLRIAVREFRERVIQVFNGGEGLSEEEYLRLTTSGALTLSADRLQKLGVVDSLFP